VATLYKKNCDYCAEKFEGRRNRRFCNANCRTSFHNEKLSDESSTYNIVLKQLRRNRSLLRKYNRAGLSFIDKKKLLDEGFVPKYFTHAWKTNSRRVYWFCFEYGFREEKRKGKVKYTLVQWQDYMK